MKKNQKKKLYPLKFVPIESKHLWGEEMWNVISLQSVSSEIAEGFLAENTLDDILETYMGDLVGDKIFDYYNLFFPLIVKVADMKGRSSLQVHPDDETGFERYDQFGKSKLWYVCDAAPDAELFIGFNRTTTASDFYTKCKDGSVKELLNVIRPKKGDSVFIAPGTVHAAHGVKIVEVQENSDLFFRLYDWGRENNPATAREMNLEEAIDLIDFERYEGAGFCCKSSAESVIASDNHFIVKSIDLAREYSVDASKFESCILYHCTEGSFSLVSDEGFKGEVKADETILVPSNSSDFVLIPGSGTTHILEISIPEPSDEIDSYTNEVIKKEDGLDKD